MNPDLATAIPRMVESGILEESKGRILLRLARGELLSIHPELRFLYYFGVLLTTTGVGLLVKENYQQIGPVAIAIGIGIGALVSFAWAVRKAPAFSWGEVPSPSLGYDYALLLGVLLAASDLAFIEVQFTPLGAHWPWHLLITSLVMMWVAVRYDSRTIFSLALSTFAAWRGLSISLIEKPLWHVTDESIRWNAVCCGLLFVLLGQFLQRTKRKPHFESPAVHLGWLLILGALVSGSWRYGLNAAVYIAVLAVVGAGLAWHSFRKQQFSLFAFGILAVCIALNDLIVQSHLDFILKSLLVSLAAVGLIAVLWKAHRKMKEPL
jgi:hypothetical protein